MIDRAYDAKDIEILMALQYNFPLTKTPYRDLAEKLDIRFQNFMEKTMRFIREGVIRRIGFNINYRIFNKVAALVAAKAYGSEFKKLIKILNEDKEVTHNFERNHKKYNIWFVIKRRSIDELKRDIDKIMSKAGIENYLILLGKRTYKLSVKFDLWKGISWSSPEILPEDLPDINYINVDLNILRKLSRGIPLKERPFKHVAEESGYSEEEILSWIRDLLKMKIIRNYGATLNGEKVGIRENGMIILKAPEEACLKIALELPEATHVVYRVPLNGKWEYPVYFMVHANSRDKIEEIANRSLDITGAEDYEILFSIRNLKSMT